MQFYCIKIRYSLEPRDGIYVKGYGFMSFTRSMSNTYGKRPFDTAKKSATDAVKTASKRAIQETAEATSDLVGNKIADKIKSISKKFAKKLPTIDEDAELTTHKKRYISPEERQLIIDELRLVPKNYYKNRIPKNSKLVRKHIR